MISNYFHQKIFFVIFGAHHEDKIENKLHKVFECKNKNNQKFLYIHTRVQTKNNEYHIAHNVENVIDLINNVVFVVLALYSSILRVILKP
jgi:hypothetical protein